MMRVIRNPFYSNFMRGNFNGAIEAWEGKTSVLFTGNGQPHRTNAWATQFWRGYNGECIDKWDQTSKATAGYAWWRAGRSVRAREDKLPKGKLFLEGERPAQ